MNRGMSIKPYLQLVRLPNVFTAACDSLAGWLLAGGLNRDRPIEVAGLMGASMAIYAAGIALNDLRDVEIDRVERPGRPLPSDAVSTRAAGLIVSLGFAIGLASATWAVGWAGFGSAGALILLVIGYDLSLRRTPLGPVAMGSCRAANLILGASATARFGGPSLWLIALALGVYVAGLTMVSRDEADGVIRSGRPRGLGNGLAMQGLALLAIAGLILDPSRFPGLQPRGPLRLVLGLAVWAVVAWVVARAGTRAVRNPGPRALQASVKTSILAMPWLHVATVSAIVGYPTALAIVAVWVPAFGLGRWLYST